jgi:hypothetical protein
LRAATGAYHAQNLADDFATGGANRHRFAAIIALLAHFRPVYRWSFMNRASIHPQRLAPFASDRIFHASPPL